MDADFTEVAKLAADLGQVASGSVGAGAALVVRKTAANVERDAKILAPVDTGNLRNSISTDVTGDGRHRSVSAEIGPTADYGIYLERGTSHMPPHPFMGPAFDRHADGFTKAMAALVDGIL